MKLFHELLDLSPGQRTNSCAVGGAGVELRYEELTSSSLRIANGLAQVGVRRGDRVALCLPNDPALVTAAIACSRLGAIFVPMNPLLRARQVRAILADCSPRVLVAGEDLITQLEELEPGAERSTVYVVWKHTGAALPHVARFDELERASSRDIQQRVIDQDLAAILYTSGSTGRPKGVMLSHRNLVEGALCVSSYLGNSADDRILAALPLSFDYGLSQVTTALRVGACAVLTQYTLPHTLVRQVAEQRITGLAGVPTMWAHLARLRWPEECISSLRYITNSGGALLTPAIEALRKALPKTRIFAMYGLTEAFRSTYLDPGELDRRPASIGKAIPNQEVLVLRADGSVCAPNEPGELVHRGSLVAQGYWNDHAATAARFRHAPPVAGKIQTNEYAVWSGDTAKTDDDGFLYFLGRMDDQIKTSGYRVNPLEVEEVVVEVEHVVTAVAFGIPDEVVGYRIGIAIRAASDDAAADVVTSIRQHCRRELPLYMVPSEIHVVATIPLTPNGKPDRQALAQALSVSDPSGTAAT